MVALKKNFPIFTRRFSLLGRKNSNFKEIEKLEDQ